MLFKKDFIYSCLEEYIPEIKSILDYEGMDGQLIPEVDLKCVHNSSGMDPMPGVIKYHLNLDYKFDLVMHCSTDESNLDPLLHVIINLSKNLIFLVVDISKKTHLLALLRKNKIDIVLHKDDKDLNLTGILGKL